MTAQLSIEFSATRRDRGIKRAIDHAGERWKRLARGYLLEYLSSPRGKFLAENLREFAEARGMESPPDGRAWGHVLQSAARDQLIRKVGYAPARSSNLSPKVLWEAANNYSTEDCHCQCGEHGACPQPRPNYQEPK